MKIFEKKNGTVLTLILSLLLAEVFWQGCSKLGSFANSGFNTIETSPNPNLVSLVTYPTITYPTLALAQNADNSSYETLLTAGYAASADGGGSVFLKISEDNTSANGTRGGFRDKGGNWWELQGSPLNVKWFGAKGNGQTADDNAINQAIQAAQAKGNNPVVYLPAGSYLITNPILLLPGVHILGDGLGATGGSSKRWGTVLIAGANLSAILQSDTSTVSGPYTIENLMVLGDSPQFKVANGMNLLGQNVKVINCDVDNVSGVGVHLLPAPPPSPGSYNYQLISTHSSNNGMGIINESSGAFVFMSDFENNAGTGPNGVMNSHLSKGGSLWLGNHSQGGGQSIPTWSAVEELVISVGSEGAMSPVPDMFVGNYFEKANYSLHVSPVANLAQNPDANLIIDDNIFKPVTSGVFFDHINNISLTNSQAVYLISNATTRSLATFDTVGGGQMDGIHAGQGFTTLLNNAPNNITLTNSTWEVSLGTYNTAGAITAAVAPACAAPYSQCMNVPNVMPMVPTPSSAIALPFYTHLSRSDAIAQDNSSLFVIKTAGYATSGDGGGAIYALISSDHTSQTGSLGGFRDAGGNWWQLTGTPLNVKAFGAAGDGVTLDDAAISQALNTAQSASFGGSVFFPPGTYMISQTIRLLPATSIFGAGQNSIIRAASNMHQLLTTCVSNTAANCLSVSTQPNMIGQVAFDGNKSAGITIEEGLSVFGRDARIIGVTVENFSNIGLHVYPTNYELNPVQYSWTNTVGLSAFTNNGIGIRSETSDSWFYMNSFIGNGSNQQQTTGDVIWYGNTFSGSSIGMHFSYDGLVFDSNPVHPFGDRVIGNTFDTNSVGLSADNGGSSKIPDSQFVIDRNIFRNNVTAMSFNDLNGITISGSRIIPGATGQTGIAFNNVSGQMVRSLDIVGNLQQIFQNLPTNVVTVDVNAH